MNTKLTDEQIRSTVAGMMMAQALRDKLAADAIAGDPNARFVVFAAWRGQQKRFEDASYAAVRAANLAARQ